MVENNMCSKPTEPIITYHEKKIGKTLFRVTSIYKGEIDLKKALEELTVRKILRDENSVIGAIV
jgi:hypothetical protein